MPNFTVDWFSHNVSTWKQVFGSLDLLDSTQPLKALEVRRINRYQLYVHSLHCSFGIAQVGSWEGQSACWLLQHVCCTDTSSLTCIDTWAGAEQYEQYGGAASVR